MKRRVLFCCVLLILSMGCGAPIETKTKDENLQTVNSSENQSINDSDVIEKENQIESFEDISIETSESMGLDNVIEDDDTVENDYSNSSICEEDIIEQSNIVEENESELILATYTYEDLQETKYAKSSVNVRDLPSADGNSIGKLKKNQELSVTGRCIETGWYRIDYKEGDGYVSDNYLINEKISVQEPTAVQDSGNKKVNDRILNDSNELYFTGSTDPMYAWTEDFNCAINLANGYVVDPWDECLSMEVIVKNKNTGDISFCHIRAKCVCESDHGGLKASNGNYCYRYHGHHIPLSQQQYDDIHYIIMDKYCDVYPYLIDLYDDIVYVTLRKERHRVISYNTLEEALADYPNASISDHREGEVSMTNAPDIRQTEDSWIEEYLHSMGYFYTEIPVDLSAIENELNSSN